MATFENNTPITCYSALNRAVSLKKSKLEDVYSQMGNIVDSILRSCYKSLSTDNVSVILICFNSFKKLFNENDIKIQANKLKDTLNDKIELYVKSI